jgi:chloramphenicol 3-O-phosphotransferase
MYKALPIHVVMLCPTEAAIQQRERDRRKKGYTRMTIQQMQRAVSQTPKVGLWIDNSDQTIWQTAEEILNDLPAARVLNVG